MLNFWLREKQTEALSFRPHCISVNGIAKYFPVTYNARTYIVHRILLVRERAQVEATKATTF